MRLRHSQFMFKQRHYCGQRLPNGELRLTLKIIFGRQAVRRGDFSLNILFQVAKARDELAFYTSLLYILEYHILFDEKFED